MFLHLILFETLDHEILPTVQYESLPSADLPRILPCNFEDYPFSYLETELNIAGEYFSRSINRKL